MIWVSCLLVLGYWTEGLAYIITGTTVGPGFKRIEGRYAEACPPKYPYGFDSGTKCCAFYEADSSVSELQYEDPEEACSHGQWIPCPMRGFKCVTRHVKPAVCPSDYPLNLLGTCCSAQVAPYAPSVNQGCIGQILTEETPPECCLEGSKYAMIPCQEKRLKCQSNGIERNLSIPTPVFVRETDGYGLTFFGKNVLTEDLCDTLIPVNYWVAADWRTGSLEIDLGYHRLIRRIQIRNSHNHHHADRGTKEYLLHVSNTTDPVDWVKVHNSTLEDPNGFGCPVPLTIEDFTPTWGRYVKFEPTSYYRKSPAIQSLRLF